MKNFFKNMKKSAKKIILENGAVLSTNRSQVRRGFLNSKPEMAVTLCIIRQGS